LKLFEKLNKKSLSPLKRNSSLIPPTKPTSTTPLPRSESIQEEFVPINSLINNPENAMNDIKPETPKNTGNDAEQNPDKLLRSEECVPEVLPRMVPQKNTHMYIFACEKFLAVRTPQRLGA
jgi:hypothetical protein